MFNDKEVDKKVKYKLGIFDDIEPTNEDLYKIRDIMINNLNVKDEVINTDISELVYLKKLQSLDLRGFEFNEKILEVLKSLSNLEILKLYRCQLKDELYFDIPKLKAIVLDNCKIFNLTNFTFPENVLIVNCGTIDASKLLENRKIKDLGIKSSEIINSSSLIEMKKLKILNVDGSTLDSEDIVERLKKKKIAVSNEFEYRPIE